MADQDPEFPDPARRDPAGPPPPPWPASPAGRPPQPPPGYPAGPPPGHPPSPPPGYWPGSAAGHGAGPAAGRAGAVDSRITHQLLGAAGLAVMVMACVLLPWATIGSSEDGASFNGITPGLLGLHKTSAWGVLLILASVVTGGANLGWLAIRERALATVAVISAIALPILALANAIYINHLAGQIAGLGLGAIDHAPGIGAFLGVLAAIAVALLTTTGLRKARTTPFGRRW